MTMNGSSPALAERFCALQEPISAANAVAAVHDYAMLRWHRGEVIGVRFDPVSGRNRLCRFDYGQAISLLPEGFSVRSRVHEYGGGAWCPGANGQLFFVNDVDQQIWRVDGNGGQPIQHTDLPNTRFADLLFDEGRNRLIAISETHYAPGLKQEPANRLVTVDQRGRVAVLAKGADFYSSPTLSPDGHQLAWIEWNHPSQPWLSTRLCLVNLDTGGMPGHVQELSDIKAAWAQPRFSPDGLLHVVVDRDSWWRIERFDGERFESLDGPECTEFTTAPWQFGLSTYGWTSAGQLYALGQVNGYSQLLTLDDQGWRNVELGTPVSRLHALSLQDEQLACVVEFDNRLPAVMTVDIAAPTAETACCTLLTGGEQPAYPVSVPQRGYVAVRSEANGESTEVPYFLYRPTHIDGHTPLPLVIYTHGGPTAATAPTFKPAIQYWTQRGFMIADVNYRGSTGFGRDYRTMLAGQWGITDVQDVEAVANQLIEKGLADPRAVFIRGNSAGGYTALSALARSNLFTAGASLYGVSDPARLNELTHKFESRYLSWLIGDPATKVDRYRDRSPLRNAHRITAPVIFFQGEQDRVVLPEQTRQMANVLRNNGIEVETHYFEDEAHGFRKAENQAAILELECGFYSRSIGELPLSIL
jgi:dipeptidyl aminopeptidase/acylaminoacyl peptidase